MQPNILLFVILLLAMCLLFMVSRKLRVSYPIFLVLGGLLIGFIPGIPHITLSPNVIFLVFLPPLLFAAAWTTSWYDFWRWKRAIFSLAFPFVILTSVTVAFVSSWLIPGFTLALGFLLGGIISPTDVTAANSVLDEHQVPKRITTILEGESLLNDASGLIIFRFALAAVLTGQFVLPTAIAEFFIIAVMGIVTGIIIALVFYLIHRHLPTTPSLDAILTLITPYLMYLTAEYFHFSGVLAVVSGGLFLSFRAPKMFDFESRLEVGYFWEPFVFLLNGVVFILIGLELPVIIEGLGDYSVGEAIFYALVIASVTIMARLVLIVPNAYLPRLFSKKIRKSEARPPLKMVLLTGWAGMRGVLSVASALSIPLLLTTGEAFPFRNLILFITSVVILTTLVAQGLSLPFIVRWLKIEDVDEGVPERRQLAAIRTRMAKLALKYLNDRYSSEMRSNNSLRRLREQTRRVVRREKFVLSDDDDEPKTRLEEREVYQRAFLEILTDKRRELIEMRAEQRYDNRILLDYEHSLDLEQARMQQSIG